MLEDTDTTPNDMGSSETSPAPSVGDDLRAAMADLSSDEPPASAPDTTEPGDLAGAAPPEPSTDSEGGGLAAPASWTATAREAWASLPAEVQEQVNQRERDIDARLRDNSAIEKVLEPYQDAIAAAGVDSGQYIGNLLKWNAAIRSNPQQAILSLNGTVIQDATTARAVIDSLSSRFNLDNDGFSDGYQEPAQQQAVDPRIDELMSRFDQMEVNSAVSEWNAFVAAKGADGKPLRPHAETLRQDMIGILRANPRLTYDDAYEQAQWVNPEVRQQIIDEQVAAKEREQVGAGQRQADSSRTMQLPRGRSDQRVATPSDGGTVRADLLNAMDELNYKF